MERGHYHFRRHGQLDDAIVPDAMPGTKAGNPLVDVNAQAEKQRARYVLLGYDKKHTKFAEDLAFLRTQDCLGLLEAETETTLYQLLEVDDRTIQLYRNSTDTIMYSDSKRVLLTHLFGELEKKLEN